MSELRGESASRSRGRPFIRSGPLASLGGINFHGSLARREPRIGEKRDSTRLDKYDANDYYRFRVTILVQCMGVYATRFT